MKRRLRLAVLSLLLLLLVLATATVVLLRGSLPQLAGARELPGLRAPVSVHYDAQGVPTIAAKNRLDLARATGFVHAQSVFFRMDLSRRTAAGELSELVGRSALTLDRSTRMHQLRVLAQNILSSASEPEQALLQAYSEGVNAGLGAMRSRPFEYWLLRQAPRPWLPEDSVLVALSMWLELTDEQGVREAMLRTMDLVLPPPLVAFLTQTGTHWDAPLEGEPLPVVPVPGPEVYDLRQLKGVKFRRQKAARARPVEPALGSNAWAVAGAHSANGGALIANDMHLGLSVPNTWFRARLQLSGEVALDVTGVMLPGLPFVIAGSNGHIAWGFTNSYGDYSDLVLLQPAPGDRSRYRAAEGYRPFDLMAERIRVRGEEDVILNFKRTLWGPVVGKDVTGRDLAVHWLGAQPEATNLRLAGLEQARSVDEALAVAHGAGIPPQNLLVADRSGRIAWTVAGRLPRRAAYDASRPSDWSSGGGWLGWHAPAEYPRVVDPLLGRLWSANARMVGGEALQRLGDGGYEFGARAQQIRGTLLALPQATTADMLQIQLDDRALFLTRWQGLLIKALESLKDPHYSKAVRVVRQWGGEAHVDSAGYHLVRAFHDRVSARAFDAITAACRKRDPNFERAYLRQWEGALLQLIEAEATHLLDPQYENVDVFLQALAMEVVDEIGIDQAWGQVNRAAIRHPLSRALPGLAAALDMPADPLPGDLDVPRVQRPGFGASQRFAVSPGRESEGYFQMPGGQSGHPLSPFYGAGHAAWVRGEPAPFLPGPAQHHLQLTPASP